MHTRALTFAAGAFLGLALGVWIGSHSPLAAARAAATVKVAPVAPVAAPAPISPAPEPPPPRTPRFADFPATPAHGLSPVPPDLKSPEANRFRTRLRQGALEGPNFAGHFTIVRWGCGTSCQVTAVVDAASGQVWFAPFTTSVGVAFRLDSRLLVTEPSDQVEAAFDGAVPEWLGEPAFYEWTGADFRKLPSP